MSFKLLLVPFAIMILAAMMLFGLQATISEAGEDFSVTNETWTPDPGNVTQLENSEITGAYYDNDTTVYNTTGTSAVEMDRGTDYEWIKSNGTIKAVVGGSLDGATEATVSYQYQVTTQEQREFNALLSIFPRAMAYIVPVFALIILIVFIKGM